MSGSVAALAVGMVGVGLWIMYAAYKGESPVKVALSIIGQSSPGSSRTGGGSGSGGGGSSSTPALTPAEQQAASNPAAGSAFIATGFPA